MSDRIAARRAELDLDRRERTAHLDLRCEAGRTHEATAARHDHIVAHRKAAGLGALADTPTTWSSSPAHKATRYRKLTTGQKTANKVIAAGRAHVEHGFAHYETGSNTDGWASA